MEKTEYGMDVPSQLLNSAKFKDGQSNKLDSLSKKYNTNKTIENKKELLTQELNMLWDEIENPKKTLIRNYSSISRYKNKGEDLKEVITLCNITALNRIENLQGDFAPEKIYSDKKIDTLKKIYEEADNSSKNTFQIKHGIIRTMCALFKTQNSTPETIKNIKNALLELSQNEKSKELREYATGYAQFKKNPTEDEKKLLINKLLSNSVEPADNTKEFTKEIPKLICDPTYSKSLRSKAIWAAGKCQSKENFNLLKKIALDKTEEPNQARHFAIQSLALYMRNNFDEVHSTLEEIAKEKSDYGLLSNILIQKIDGKFHGVKNREITNNNVSQIGSEMYAKEKENYIKTEKHFNIANNNVIDSALLPLKGALASLNGSNINTKFIEDTITKLRPDNIGKRLFYNDTPNNSGAFQDSIIGMNGNYGTIIQKKEVSPRKSNTLAHEFAHAVHRDVLSSEASTINTLYKNALKDDRCLDYYAKLNDMEYFAQGYEAYTSIYKGHSQIIHTEHPSTNTRFYLKDKDPELYSFIENCTKIYC